MSFRADPVTLPMHCYHCHGPVTLRFGRWPVRGGPPVTQAWRCPHCEKVNAAGFPGRLAWVTKRDDVRAREA